MKNTLTKHLVLVLLSVYIIVSYGCLGPKKMDKWVKEEFGDEVQDRSGKIKADYIRIYSPLITSDVLPSHSTKKTTNFLPLLFYWQSKFQLTCTLNPVIPINIISGNIVAYANAKNLKQKLNGQQIELTIEKVPNEYTFHNNEHIIFLILFKYSWYQTYLAPESRSLVVSYKLLKDNIETKTGTITIPEIDQEKGIRYFQSIKNATGEYIAQYQENLKADTKLLVDKIIEEL